MAAVLSTRFAVAVTLGASQWQLASVAGVQVGHVCVAESEVARVVGVGPATTVTVQRGVEGTAAAAHATGTPVAIYRAGEVDTDAPVLGAAAVPLRQATVTLTDAQIKAVPLTPVVVIPATETLDYEGAPTQVPILRGAYIVTNDWPTAYIGYAGALVGFTLWLGSDISSWTVAEAGSSFPGGNVDVLTLRILTGQSSLSNNLFDNAIVLAGDPVWVSAFTGGHASNTLTVTVLYSVLDVTTGVWV